jgi:hypothetical protein
MQLHSTMERVRMLRTRIGLRRWLQVALFAGILAPHVVNGRAAASAPPLPAPSGSVVGVSTDVSALQHSLDQRRLQQYRYPRRHRQS